MATETMPKALVPPRRPARPGSTRPRPVTAPRHTRPVAAPAALPVAAPGTRSDAKAGPAARRRAPRMPFILLLVGLLGGTLISLLVISTTLAQGSFRVTVMQQQDSALVKQEQVLSQEVAEAESPARIAGEATQLGMRQNPRLQFIDARTGKIVSGKVPPAVAEISIPGFTP